MRKWLTIPFVLQLVVSVGLMGFILIHAGVSSSRMILRELLVQMQQHIGDHLTQRLQDAMRLNQLNYDSFQYGILNLDSPGERERYFVNHIRPYPDVAMCFIGLEDGSFYGARRTPDNEFQVVRDSRFYKTSDSGEGTEPAEEIPGFDPRTRPWYKNAAKAGAPVFGGVYSHCLFHQPAITVSRPVYDSNHRLMGVFGVDYLLSWLDNSLSSLPLGASGQIFVTDSDGMLVGSSLGSLNCREADGSSGLMPAAESENPLIRTSLSLMQGKGTGDVPELKYQGKRYLVGVSEYRQYGIQWNIYVISGEEDFLGATKNAVMQAAVMLAVFLLFSICFTTWLAGRVTKPIVSLSNAAEEMTNGRLVTIPDSGRKDELGKLTRSFNKMGLQLTNMVSHLEDEVAVRTRELQESNDILIELSFLDGLTGLSNRRQLDIAIVEAIRSAVFCQRPMALLMLDIDLFKSFNDAYGHQAGDECLKAIARLLREKVCRATDLAARYGGEEFVILLPEASEDTIEEFANGIRKGIEELEIDHPRSAHKRVTVSIGIACLIPDKSTTPEMIIEMADKALYHAKQNGRNLVVRSDKM